MWWILHQLSIIPEIDALLVFAFTTQADHLFMCWAYHEPRRHPIYRTIRGVEVLCGYEYIWDTPNLAEQIETGDTIEHLFYLIQLRPASVVWFYVWAPDGPYGLQIQGPLMHVSLLLPPRPWTDRVYLATRLKGIYRTTNFTDVNPTWTPDNGDIPAADYQDTSQACPDPKNPYHRRFVIAGGHVHYLQNFNVGQPAHSLRVLSNQEACDLTGSPAGDILWIAGNINYLGYFTVLFNSALGTNGTWCIRTFNYGLAWEAHQIFTGPLNFEAGNIIAGIEQGASPYDPGLVLYAALNIAGGGNWAIFMSSNNGFTWAEMDREGLSIERPRCLVDPTDQSIVYMGVFRGPFDPRELYRSVTHGALMAEVDGLNHLGIFTGALKGQMWIDPSDNWHAKVLQQAHIWATDDYCVSWATPGPMPVPVTRLTIRKGYPDSLYLARDVSAPIPLDAGGYHVIFTSDDDGITLYGKSGAHPDQHDGGGNSIPYSCGGAALDGILPLLY